MKFETIETIPCDVCGEEFLPHMLNTNSFTSQLTCEHCDAEIARDMEEFAQAIKWKEPIYPDDRDLEQIRGGGYVADDRFYGDEG